ncbi:MAG TPA: DUF4214 domain-containing protein, partial [Ramlibacter sp.]|nr:DUF4214 domain-containing protein [Ramlibacter sp.]
MYVDTDVNGTAAQVYRLYRAAFSRVADPGGLGFQVGQIEVARHSLQEVAANFVASPEFSSTYGSLSNTQFVTLLYTNVLHRAPDEGGLAFHVNNLNTGTPRAVVLLGFSESNENKSQTAADVAAGLRFQPWPNGRVFLTDGNYFETDPSGTAAQVFRLYQAAFARTADAGGLGFHIGNIELAGLSISQVASNFMASPEFQQKYGALSNTDFVTQLYANVLHRPPDSGGLVYWTNLLATGTPRVAVMLGFSESPENRSNTLDSVFAGLRFQPWPSAPSMPAVTAPTGVTGTAAIGAALANATITLKDSANVSSTTTAEANGRFRVDTTNLNAPFLLRASFPGAPAIYSVSTTASASGTINVTPLTDTVVRSWYLLKNQFVETAFASTLSAPAPSPTQTDSILQALSPVLQLGAQASGAALSNATDVIDKPFNADGTGIDLLLANTHVTSRSSGFDLTIAAGNATQQTAIDVSSGASTISASSTTTQGDTVTTAFASTFVPVQPAQVDALTAIQARLAGASAVINSRGSALAASDLEPYFDANMVNDGEGRATYLANVVEFASQATNFGLSLNQLQSLDVNAGTASGRVTVTVTSAGQTISESDAFYFRKVGGTWMFTGNGRIARMGLQAEARRDSPNGPGGTSVNLDVRPPAGTVTSVSASSSFAIPSMQTEAQEFSDGILFDVFVSNTGPITGPLPAPGTPVVFTLGLQAGGSVQYTLPINTWTNELITLTGPTQTTLPPGPVTVSWTRPTTYAVQRVKLGISVLTGDTPSSGFQCISDEVTISPSATSAQGTVAATCNGQPAKSFTINVATEGP